MKELTDSLTVQLLPYVAIFVFFAIVVFFLTKFFLNKKSTSNQSRGFYERKDFMTAAESSFFQKIKRLETEQELIVAPQINLATIIQKTDGAHFQNELFRNIDFAVFSANYKKVLLLIELNDSTHNLSNRRARDQKVRAICGAARIPLLTFYTNKPNSEKYVHQRILKTIREYYQETERES